MKTRDFDYHLPDELIAQKSVEPRDASRLLVVDRATHAIEHKSFRDIVDLLGPDDVLVWNNSKVFKARLHGQLITPEGEPLRDHDKPVEIFLVRPMTNAGVWKVLAKPGKHVRNGTRVKFADDFYCDVVAKEPSGSILVQFPEDEAGVRAKANEYGDVPIPPYVKDEKHELESYQTVYANKEKEGSVAAPTAGFHFTDRVIDALKEKGVQFAAVTLHVGLGTFLPVKSETVEDHVMHSEWVEISQEAADTINRARAAGKRIIAVGTTTVRTLEGVAQHLDIQTDGQLDPYDGDINMFITPGFEFRMVDGLITNFHLPKSTLLMLVAAFIGDREWTIEIYEEAVQEAYRFYSFGDAMVIV